MNLVSYEEHAELRQAKTNAEEAESDRDIKLMAEVIESQITKAINNGKGRGKINIWKPKISSPKFSLVHFLNCTVGKEFLDHGWNIEFMVPNGYQSVEWKVIYKSKL